MWFQKIYQCFTPERLYPLNGLLPVRAGTYNAKIQTESRKDGRIYDIPGIQLNDKEVAVATGIQLHEGNEAKHVKVCFSVGAGQEENSVTNSRKTLEKINDIIQADGTGEIIVLVAGYVKK